MKATIARAFAGTTLLLVPSLAAHAGELFTPGLPANGSQFLECRVINVSGAPVTVTTEAFISTGASSSGPLTETLASGAAGGFSLSGIYASMYCKFTVKGSTRDVRASIDVLENPPGGPTAIKVALPAT